MAEHPAMKFGISALLLIALLAIFSVPVCAATDPAKGSFLVAAEKMTDPRFKGSVILLLQHGTTGSIGLIVNRPLSISLDHAFNELPEAIAGNQPLYFGGPVDPKVTWILFEGNSQMPGSIEIIPGVFVANAAQYFSIADNRTGSGRIRVLTGYAGWAPGQLELELRRGDWKVNPARAADVFDDHPESLWEYLLGKGGVLI